MRNPIKKENKKSQDIMEKAKAMAKNREKFNPLPNNK